MSVYLIGMPTPTRPRCRTKGKKWLRARLERVFDKLYAEAERVLNAHKPCKVKLNQHGASCLDCRHGHSKVNMMCCGGCKWHTPSGCTANKPLTCRTWLCWTVQKHDPEAYRKLRRIANRMHRLGFYAGRGDREDSIQKALDYFRGVTHTKHFPELALG